ncbi:CRISPR locus-related DNA-binding protein [Sulfolobus islandicus]|nr:CRISPR-associated CARF protein Csa3 [Sulfolobus islandicus]WCM36859.1 CRISPR locus-related DNA-binding protein [Sulfolobus islandicus]
MILPYIMMKSYFVTLGFNETYLLRLLNETSAQREDKLLIVVPSPIVEGTKAAIENLKIQTLRLRYPNPEIIEIKISSFDDILSQLLDNLLPLQEPVISDLTMGMRLMNTLILIAILVSRKKFTIYLRDENGGSRVVSFTSSDINALFKEYSSEEFKMLYSIFRNNAISTFELSKILGKSEKTIQNKISELKKLGILTQKGKDRTVELTSLGLNVIKLIKNSKLYIENEIQ